MKAKVTDIIVQALVDLDVKTVTNVPGYGGSEVFEAYSTKKMKNLPVSFHEEVAYTIAHSSAICGTRSAVLTKAQGVAKAMNSIVDSLYTDLTAGMLVLVFDDRSGAHSDNIMETEPLLNGISLPFHSAQIDTIYEDIISAVNESEKLQMPVALIVDTDMIDKEGWFEPHNNLLRNVHYKRDILHHVVHPYLAEYQYKIFTAKKMGGDRFAIHKPELPKLPESLPERYKESAEKYTPFFEIFKTIKRDITTGDTSISSSFAFPPYNAIDIVTYIGGSIPLAIGAYYAGNKKVWALSGDFGFLAAGHYGLLEALNRELPVKVVIFYNKSAGATGGQKIQKKTMLRILAGYDHFITHISNPSDPFEIQSVLEEVNSKDELQIVLVDY